MGDTLGGFEKLLLLAVLQLGEEAYGAAIFEELRRRTERETSPGAVYVTLRRLEAKQMLRSRTGAPSPERGGRPRKLYTVEAAGLRALRDARREWDAMVEGLDGLLGEGS